MANKETKEAVQVIAEAMREALKTVASEALDAKRLIASDAEKATKLVDDKYKASRDTGTIQSIIYKQVSLFLSIAGVLLAGFIYLTSPSQANDTALQLQDQRITAQQETIDTITRTAQNDTQELKAAVKELVDKVNDTEKALATLTAIINERIPAKK